MPRCWLMLDARLEEAGAGAKGLTRALAALPPRSAVVVRPCAMTEAQRRAWRTLHYAARARGHRLLWSDERIGQDGRHLTRRSRPGRQPTEILVSASVHDTRELGLAKRRGAHALLVSPVGVTRSHAGAAALGTRGFARLAARRGSARAIALGGMTPERFRTLRRHGAHGWAAIDAWLA